MARRRFEQLPRERQDEILRVAAEEFAHRGFSGTSYNQLLDRLKLGKSSAYYYFEDKRDLFLTAVGRCYAVYFESLRRFEMPNDVDGYWRYVRDSSREGFEFMVRDPTAAALLRCLHRERDLLGALLTDDVLGQQSEIHETLVARGQELGAVRTDLPRDLLVRIAANLSVTFDQWFASLDDPSAHVEEAARDFTSLARRLFAPEIEGRGETKPGG